MPMGSFACWITKSSSRPEKCHMKTRYREWVKNLHLQLVHQPPAYLWGAIPGLDLP